MLNLDKDARGLLGMKPVLLGKKRIGQSARRVELQHLSTDDEFAISAEGDR